MKILFILALIALMVFAVSSIIKERRYTKIIRLVSCSLAVVLSLIVAIAAPYLRSLGIGVAVLAVVSYGLSIFARQFKSDGVKAFVKYTANAILVILLLEAVCFNFNSYHLWKGGYDETPLDMSAATLTNVTQNGNPARSQRNRLQNRLFHRFRRRDQRFLLSANGSGQGLGVQ